MKNIQKFIKSKKDKAQTKNFPNPLPRELFDPTTAHDGPMKFYFSSESKAKKFKEILFKAGVESTRYPGKKKTVQNDDGRSFIMLLPEDAEKLNVYCETIGIQDYIPIQLWGKSTVQVTHSSKLVPAPSVPPITVSVPPQTQTPPVAPKLSNKKPSAQSSYKPSVSALPYQPQYVSIFNSPSVSQPNVNSFPYQPSFQANDYGSSYISRFQSQSDYQPSINSFPSQPPFQSKSGTQLNTNPFKASSQIQDYDYGSGTNTPSYQPYIVSLNNTNASRIKHPQKVSYSNYGSDHGMQRLKITDDSLSLRGSTWNMMQQCKVNVDSANNPFTNNPFNKNETDAEYIIRLNNQLDYIKKCLVNGKEDFLMLQEATWFGRGGNKFTPINEKFKRELNELGYSITCIRSQNKAGDQQLLVTIYNHRTLTHHPEYNKGVFESNIAGQTPKKRGFEAIFTHNNSGKEVAITNVHLDHDFDHSAQIDEYISTKNNLPQLPIIGGDTNCPARYSSSRNLIAVDKPTNFSNKKRFDMSGNSTFIDTDPRTNGIKSIDGFYLNGHHKYKLRKCDTIEIDRSGKSVNILCPERYRKSNAGYASSFSNSNSSIQI